MSAKIIYNNIEGSNQVKEVFTTMKLGTYTVTFSIYIRCGLCSRFFCCPRHRLDHQAKAHADVYSKEGQDFLLQYFQRKAEIIMMKSQKRRVSVDGETKTDTMTCGKESDKNSNNKGEDTGIKEEHDGIHRRIETEWLVSSSQRKILIPKYRLRCSKLLSFNSTSKITYDSSKVTDENKSLNSSARTLKTSTPIIKALSVQSNWNEISGGSTISNLLTPEDTGELRSKPKGPVTPLRSIMAKMSKYQSPSSGESGPHGRRVTFSLSGQLSLSGSNSASASASGSTLHSIHEVEDGPEVMRKEERDPEECLPHDSLRCVFQSELHLKSCVHEQYVIIKDSLADSPPATPQQVGFFSCVTGMFCSAIKTIPVINSLRNVYQKHSKRSRSPEPKAVEEVPHKKPCFNCDMRENPIKCRKPISSSAMMNGEV